MHIAKKIGLIFCASLLSIFLLALTADYSVVHIFGKPQNVKKVLNDSHVYDTAVDSVLGQVKKVDTKGNDVPVTSPAFRAAAKKTFTPDFLQQQVGKVIDGFYHWLNGEAVKPDFRINLSSTKKNLANNLGGELKKRLAKLPICKTTPADFDAFKAKCLPAGMTAASAAAKVKNDLLSSKDFLKDPIITADQLQKDKSKKDIYTHDLKQLPDSFQLAKKSPWILATIVIVLAAAVFFLASSHMHGLKIVALIFLIVGLLMLLVALIVSSTSSHGFNDIKLKDNPALEETVRKLANSLGQALTRSQELIASIYILLGAGILGGEWYYRRRTPTKK